MVYFNETGVRKQNIDSWHLVFSYIKNWEAYKSLFFCYKDSVAPLFLSVRPENVRKMPFMHGCSCYYLTIKLQTSAWLACKFFVDYYFLVRPLSDARNEEDEERTGLCWANLIRQHSKSEWRTKRKKWESILYAELKGKLWSWPNSKDFYLVLH